MNVQVLQHVPFEGIGSIQQWMERRGARVSITRLFDGAPLPELAELDWLIVMGGPMSVNDEAVCSWLRAEKRLIARAVDKGKTLLGICLGAQLIASALGARVFPNERKEIGWLPVRRAANADSEMARLFPNAVEVFHWHGDTFDLPRGAARFLESDACANQAFSIGEKVVGLQFHLETTPESASALIENSRHQIVPGPTIQTEQEMLRKPERFAVINGLMDSVLESLARA
jgi:GMP synthase-like glutamine amidotransferase